MKDLEPQARLYMCNYFSTPLKFMRLLHKNYPSQNVRLKYSDTTGYNYQLKFSKSITRPPIIHQVRKVVDLSDQQPIIEHVIITGFRPTRICGDIWIVSGKRNWSMPNGDISLSSTIKVFLYINLVSPLENYSLHQTILKHHFYVHISLLVLVPK